MSPENPATEEPTPDLSANGIWQRLPRESGDSYSAFCAHLELGPDSTLQHVADKIGRSVEAVRHLSSRHNWMDRAAAYRQHVSHTFLATANRQRAIGIKLRLANTDRINGWAEILKRFGDPSCSLPPRLFIHRRCTRLIECLPLLQHDPNRPEDVLKIDVDEDGVGGDDAADCFRYLVASKARIITMEKLVGL